MKKKLPILANTEKKVLGLKDLVLRHYQYYHIQFDKLNLYKYFLFVHIFTIFVHIRIRQIFKYSS